MPTVMERPTVPAAVRLLPVGAGLWRVLDDAGRAIGHLAAREDDARFAALRFHAGSARFREVGSFWSAAEAVECLRLSR
ncbi:hypothetical protein [uncultured Microbacterium sp.]|uniref:DNA mismatch repair protein n=1 Tax=uncultured Microbacterium sp. TaxID=191216 RepID=A0A1Y5NW97_9MICO|nr:hypothetical protein [uncultured Microbacterium sp.]SBS70726.1 hypothetical protein MIPYR_10621 [uncultured Microbacterium sp.]